MAGEEKRRDALQELLETERTYVQRMQITFKVYIRGSVYLLTESDRTALFSNLEDILFANTGFLQDLEERFNSGTEFSIGDIFLKHIPKFSVYMVYCRNQHSSIQFLQDKMSNSDFSKFIRDSLSNPECTGLDLASFLLEPVQRITRYPMLLKQIKKYTSANIDEFIDVAIEECEALLQRVNISMQEGEEQYKLQKLQRRLSSHGRLSSITLESLTSQSKLPTNLAGLTRAFNERKLLKSGLWIKLKSRRKLLVFLFSDFLMMTEAVSGDTELNLLHNDEAKLKIYRMPIHLDDIWLLKEVEAAKIPDAYRDNHEFRALEIETCDVSPLHVHIKADEYEDWVETIASAKRRLKVSNTHDIANPQSVIRGTLRLSIQSASQLYTEGSYYCQVQTPNGAFRYSTPPAKAPNPVWNQILAVSIDHSTDWVEVELFRYSQFEINDSLGRARISLDSVINDEGAVNLGTTSLHLLPSPVQLVVNLVYTPKK